MPTSCLNGSDVLADGGQIRVALACVLHAEMTDFTYNRIGHGVPSINSSGEQISGASGNSGGFSIEEFEVTSAEQLESE